MRRIVTGHNEAGEAVVAADEQMAGISATRRSRDTRGQCNHDPRVEYGLRAPDRRAAPGTRSPMHRTGSLDYGICLEDECDMELDGGETVTVRAGDVVVQRGTNHLWHNRGTVPCRFAWILLDAQPVEIAGRTLGGQSSRRVAINRAPVAGNSPSAISSTSTAWRLGRSSQRCRYGPGTGSPTSK